MNFDDMTKVVNECTYPAYNFDVKIDGRGAIYLQAYYDEPDTQTGRVERQVTRRWFLSPEMTKSEIVQTAFKCILTSQEHRCREWFAYQNEAVYGPHFDVDALIELCRKDKLSYRKNRNAEEVLIK